MPFDPVKTERYPKSDSTISSTVTNIFLERNENVSLRNTNLNSKSVRNEQIKQRQTSTLRQKTSEINMKTYIFKTKNLCESGTTIRTTTLGALENQRRPEIPKN
ncbi:hypothetical protein NPIL_237611 [Nephila pilipes]|uniref:Uncharacterized protein n=1 Tax=Nephila pilipes TaxID=299642 RepID=A0A8X6TM16_NEPPI|nr:hypothetical protein NPIL_237611 [Nephila pilipes]